MDSDSSKPPEAGSGLLCPIPLGTATDRPRLLVVDDDEPTREVLSRRLEQRGYDTRQAASGSEALALIAQETFDVVLLAGEMPAMKGDEVLQRIRLERPAGVLPVIMVTARDRSEDVVEALALGANDYVVKPIDLQVTLARIDTQLQRRRTEAQIREREARYAAAIAGANEGIFDWTLSTNELFCSDGWRERFGCSPAGPPMLVEDWFERIHEEDRPRVRRDIDAHIAGLSAQLQVEYRMRDAGHQYRWVLTRGLAARDASGRAIRLAGSFTDITEGKEADSLTSLSSRVLFMDRLQGHIEAARRRPSFAYAVLLVEVQGLKAVNDTQGRAMGDRLLVAVARRLEYRARVNWTAPETAGASAPDARPTVARFDGDEFAMILPGVQDSEGATRIAEGIHEAFKQPVVLDGLSVYVTANIGILARAASYRDPEDVLRDAGIALSLAKVAGRSRHEVFEPEMRDRMLIRQQVERSLRPALERGEFRLHYQPIVRLDRESLVGFEALLRWQHPERGLLFPDAFVSLAEETSLIVGIGRWVVREACRQLGEWRDAGLGGGQLRVGINLSTQEFQQPDLVDYVSEVLREYRLGGAQIEVEITESTAMAQTDLVVTRLAQLRGLGVSVCLDDFGAGHSSLAYLHRLPVDKVKIDRSFVSRLFAVGDRDSRPIVRAVLAMARDMGIEVVAEGVEDVAQLDLLCGLSCQLGQGYLFSEPLEPGLATRTLREGLATSGWQMGQRSLLSGADGQGQGHRPRTP